MCGICGIVGDHDPVLLERMLNRLVHRGPDDEGTHHDPGLSLGVRRLQVIDPRGGHQPVRNETGSVWAVLNGEIYNYRELRKELIQKGHRFQSDGDTEVLVHLYEEEGPEGVYRLRGMFAYAIWDRERDLILLVRDRLGIKPLYYSVQPGHAGAAHLVLFSSELPSLLEGLPGWTIRPQAIADFLSLLYVPGPDTIVEGVYQLRPGEALKIVRGEVAFWRYYRPEEEVPCQVEASQGDQRERFLHALRDSVQAHLSATCRSDCFCPVGWTPHRSWPACARSSQDRSKHFPSGTTRRKINRTMSSTPPGFLRPTSGRTIQKPCCAPMWSRCCLAWSPAWVSHLPTLRPSPPTWCPSWPDSR